jgi:hypothetical protein
VTQGIVQKPRQIRGSSVPCCFTGSVRAAISAERFGECPGVHAVVMFGVKLPGRGMAVDRHADRSISDQMGDGDCAPPTSVICRGNTATATPLSTLLLVSCPGRGAGDSILETSTLSLLCPGPSRLALWKLSCPDRWSSQMRTGRLPLARGDWD